MLAGVAQACALLAACALPFDLVGGGDRAGVRIHEVGVVVAQRELELALSLNARVIGINNRNLETLEIEPDTALRLLPLIPRDVIAVAESGVRSRNDASVMWMRFCSSKRMRSQRS